MDIIDIKKTVPKYLGTVIITHNRLDLTRITIESYVNTIVVPHELLIIDNNSDDETKEYLKSLDLNLIILDENKYPGYAVNLGWKELVDNFPDVKYLHRSDNDIFYRSGWDRYAVAVMESFPKLGQFGFLDLSDYFPFGTVPLILRESGDMKFNGHYWDIGGSFLIRREIWDDGVRHEEKKWSPSVKPEDKILTEQIVEKGWQIGHSIDPIVTHLGVGYGWSKNNINFEYYKKTFHDRGLPDFGFKIEELMEKKNKFQELGLFDIIP